METFDLIFVNIIFGFYFVLTVVLNIAFYLDYICYVGSDVYRNCKPKFNSYFDYSCNNIFLFLINVVFVIMSMATILSNFLYFYA